MMDDKFAVTVEVLEAMRGIELLVAELYRSFAQAFPRDRELWEALSLEEEVHAVLADGLKGLIQTTDLPPAPGRINLASLGTYRKGLESYLGRLRKGELNRKTALYIARDVEKTLVERAFYGFIEYSDPDYQAIQGRIEGETESHLNKLETYIAKHAGELG